MQKELEEYKDIAKEVDDVIQIFLKMVSEVKYSSSKIIPHLKSNANQLDIVYEMLENPVETYKKEDVEDFKLALSHVKVGIGKMIEIAADGKKYSDKLGDRIRDLKSRTSNKKNVVQDRINFGEKKWENILGLGGAAGGLYAANMAINAAAFGGAGALVVGGVAFPPIGVLAAGALVGGSAIYGLVLLIRKLWTEHQYKAVKFLDAILLQLVDLAIANQDFSNEMNNALKLTNDFNCHLDTIQLSLLSERQRKANRILLSSSRSSAEKMINCLTDISQLEYKRVLNIQ